MQTLGIYESTPRSENRLKSLFWPSIDSGADVDYLGVQGYWICTLVSIVTLAALCMVGQPIMGIIFLLLYYIGGVGVREHSRYAVVTVFAFYVLNVVLSPGIVGIIFSAVLLSNVRATWIAANWKPDSEESILPPRMGGVWSDKLSDQLPAWLWPKVRILYYIFSAGLFLLVTMGLTAKLAIRAAGH